MGKHTADPDFSGRTGGGSGGSILGMRPVFAAIATPLLLGGLSVGIATGRVDGPEPSRPPVTPRGFPFAFAPTPARASGIDPGMIVPARPGLDEAMIHRARPDLDPRMVVPSVPGGVALPLVPTSPVVKVPIRTVPTR